MIRLHFYDYGNGQLDIEKELGITSDIIDFLIANIPIIEFEATDNVADMDDNWIYWFSSTQELEAVSDIKKLIIENIGKNSSMKFDVKIDEM